MFSGVSAVGHSSLQCVHMRDQSVQNVPYKDPIRHLEEKHTPIEEFRAIISRQSLPLNKTLSENNPYKQD